MSIYKVKKSWLYTSAKRNQIPMCRIAGKNYYSTSVSEVTVNPSRASLRTPNQ